MMTVAFPLFSRKKKAVPAAGKPLPGTPAIRCSICTGEQVAGFRDRISGHFEEVALIHNEQELEEFRRRYGIEGEIPKFY